MRLYGLSFKIGFTPLPTFECLHLYMYREVSAGTQTARKEYTAITTQQMASAFEGDGSVWLCQIDHT